MEAWGAARGHQPPLEGGGVWGSLGHTITDDDVCVPALILLFGQTYAENDGGAPMISSSGRSRSLWNTPALESCVRWN